MKRVSRCMYAHEPHPLVDRFQEIFLSVGRHRRLSVRAQSREIASGEKNYRGVRVKLVAVKNSTIFRHSHPEPVFIAEIRHGVVDNAGLAVDALHHLVFKARGFREHQHGFLWCGGQTLGQRQTRACDRYCLEKFSAFGSCTHGVLSVAPRPYLFRNAGLFAF